MFQISVFIYDAILTTHLLGLFCLLAPSVEYVNEKLLAFLLSEDADNTLIIFFHFTL
jgi:hypothetical protein